MGKKYHFRKMHFICYKNKVINQFLTFVNAYKDRDHAEKVLAEKTTKRDFIYLWEKPEDMIPREKVESFYLVHESLYEKILKEHDIDAK
jgi:hypothetical protein